jgi:hypothetical protein
VRKEELSSTSGKRKGGLRRVGDRGWLSGDRRSGCAGTRKGDVLFSNVWALWGAAAKRSRLERKGGENAGRSLGAFTRIRKGGEGAENEEKRRCMNEWRTEVATCSCAGAPAMP